MGGIYSHFYGALFLGQYLREYKLIKKFIHSKRQLHLSCESRLEA